MILVKLEKNYTLRMTSSNKSICEMNVNSTWNGWRKKMNKKEIAREAILDTFDNAAAIAKAYAELVVEGKIPNIIETQEMDEENKGDAMSLIDKVREAQ